MTVNTKNVHIEKITISKSNKTTLELSLQRKVNIIKRESDAEKSYICEIIRRLTDFSQSKTDGQEIISEEKIECILNNKSLNKIPDDINLAFFGQGKSIDFTEAELEKLFSTLFPPKYYEYQKSIEEKEKDIIETVKKNRQKIEECNEYAIREIMLKLVKLQILWQDVFDIEKAISKSVYNHYKKLSVQLIPQANKKLYTEKLKNILPEISQYLNKLNEIYTNNVFLFEAFLENEKYLKDIIGTEYGKIKNIFIDKYDQLIKIKPPNILKIRYNRNMLAKMSICDKKKTRLIMTVNSPKYHIIVIDQPESFISTEDWFEVFLPDLLKSEKQYIILTKDTDILNSLKKTK